LRTEKPKGKLLDSIWQRFRKLFRGFTGLSEESETEEPIDFSAPSVPYYANLAERFNLARIVLYMVLFVFVVVTVVCSRHLITYENLYYLVKDINAAGLTAQSMADSVSYPVSDAMDFAPYRGGLAVVGGEEITVLSASGKQTLSENVALSHPEVRTSDPYFLAFSRGEQDFSVYNGFVCVRKTDTDHPVYDACMARDGAYAVLTRSDEHTSVALWYDADLNKRIAVNRGGYITAMALSPDGLVLATLELDVEDGGYTTKLSFTRQDGSEKHAYLEGTAVLSAAFLADDRLAVISQDKLSIYRTDGDLISETPFGNRRPLLTDMGDGYAALLLTSEKHLSRQELWVFDRNGKEEYRASPDLDGSAKELLLNGREVYIRMNDRILWVTDHGEDVREAEGYRDAQAMLALADGGVLVCSPGYAERLETEDFSD